MQKTFATVRDIVNAMEEIAPPELAESWDNVGLQIGDERWRVSRVRVALDPILSVVKEACRDGINMLITHHPLIFRPMKNLDFNTPLGKMARMSVESRLAIFSAHTNLDSAKGGINDFLCEKIGLKNLYPLQEVAGGEKKRKLVVFVPKNRQREALVSLCSLGAGKIGAYDCCFFRSDGKGSFKPGAESSPYAGKGGELKEVDEVRIEVEVYQSQVLQAVQALKTIHPHETMAYNVYKLESTAFSGLGRVGDLENPASLADFSIRLRDRLGLSYVKTAGDPQLQIKKAAICSGSGSGLMKTFFSSGAQVYVSGDLHYHDAREVESLNRGLVDIGHFGSERVVTDFLVKCLQDALDQKELPVSVDASSLEKDPFKLV